MELINGLEGIGSYLNCKIAEPYYTQDFKEYSLKELVKYFYREKNNTIKNIVPIKADDPLNLCMQEIVNRFCKILGIHSVAISSMLPSKDTFVTAIKINKNKVDSSSTASMVYNCTRLKNMSILNIMHECEHLKQLYSLQNLRQQNDKNKFLAGCLLIDRNVKNLIEYEHRPEELDANIQAVHQIRKLIDNNIIDSSKEIENSILNKELYILNSFKYRAVKNNKNSVLKNCIEKLDKTVSEFADSNDFEYRLKFDELKRVDKKDFIDYCESAFDDYSRDSVCRELFLVGDSMRNNKDKEC
jgi:hypothetical protein